MDGTESTGRIKLLSTRQDSTDEQQQQQVIYYVNAFFFFYFSVLISESEQCRLHPTVNYPVSPVLWLLRSSGTEYYLWSVVAGSRSWDAIQVIKEFPGTRLV